MECFLKLCVLLAAAFCLSFVQCSFGTARPIQIGVPVNHTLQWQMDDFKSVLLNDEIKDRAMVIISIAGAFRQGKSFLLNFFLKYLYAQYKNHNVTDWMGINSDGKVEGFKWRGGRKRETIGIWMWSEIFTHEMENGDKIAIILIDTQGIFDRESSLKDHTTIFSLSMALASVQLYNVVRNIREDHLYNLQLFTDYGRLAVKETNRIPFQKLYFVVRDWAWKDEGIGWDGKTVIDNYLKETNEQSSDMRQLRRNIKESFEELNAFLMPYPGSDVANGQFSGKIKEIAPDFIKYVDELVLGILSPEKLTLKKIYDRKVRAKDLLRYLEAYLMIFNGNKITEANMLSNVN